jgi:hypothetical protein
MLKAAPMRILGMQSRQIVFVLGMGRTGSSALTRLISLCGAQLPAELFGPDPSNPAGHWEPLAALQLNDAFLHGRGATWWDPTLRLQHPDAISAADAEIMTGRIESFLNACPAAPVVVIKEPRIVALSALWLAAAKRSGFTIKAAIPVRHPDEVAASLAARDGVGPELASVLWLKYSLLAERSSRQLPRVFVEYPNILADWRKEIARISRQLSVDLNAADPSAVDVFLDRSLHRQQSRATPRDMFVRPWLSETYAALSAACRDEPLDCDRLDAIFSEFAACESAFRIAFDQSRERFGSPQ